jgi:hypothetical protein
MLTMLGTQRRCCDGLTRRESLRAGTLSALGGLSLPALLRAEEARAAGAVGSGPAKSVIVLYLLGGAATQDMYDMKPDAPSDIRGEFQPIASSAPGLDVCEHLPQMAKWMHRAAVVRTVHHKGGCHNPLPSYTGDETIPDTLLLPKSSQPPSMGAVCEYLNGGRVDNPAYVYMPCYLGWGQSIKRPGPYAGFLGAKYDGLYTECAPYVDNPPDLPYRGQPLRGMPVIPLAKLGGDMTVDRLDARRTLLSQLDAERYRRDEAGSLGSFNRQEQRAWSILTSSRVREAFDLDKVDPKVKDRYTPTLFGHSTLIANRLVDAGVRFVNVTWDSFWERLQLQYDCWDTHNVNHAYLKKYLLPYLDAPFGALMEDLDRTGRLDETLVVIMSEMGRTPRINANAGRDHWPFCYSVMLAGAGIRGGSVYGKSDAQAAYPQDKPASPADIVATIYHCLGIDPEMLVSDQVGRPQPVARSGTPIWEILA